MSYDSAISFLPLRVVYLDGRWKMQVSNTSFLLHIVYVKSISTKMKRRRRFRVQVESYLSDVEAFRRFAFNVLEMHAHVLTVGRYAFFCSMSHCRVL
jgi:hypothetical protein